MTDRALANAEKRRDEISSEIDKLNQSLAELRKSLKSVENFISDWHRFADVAMNSGAADAGPHSREDTGRPRIIPRILPQDGATRTASKNPDKTIVGQHAKAIIHELGRPVSRSELFTLLRLRGIDLEANEPEMVLSMLWRTPGEEDFDFLNRNILDPASVADVEPSEDHVEVTLYHGYGLRPQKHGDGWIVHIEPGVSQPGELTRSTITFAELEGALDEAKKIVMKDLVGAARLRRF